MSVLWLLALLGCDRIGSEDVIDRYDFDRDGHHAIASGGDDCDDRDADVNPSADEVCGDGVDNNCDGGVDDSGTGEVTWFVDGDGDGFGEAEVVTCAKPEGAVAAGGDCDDGDVDVHPGAAERCDGVDQDCDGKIDDGLDVETQYADADGDGYGDDAVSESRCVSAGDAWVVAGGDCDDGDAAVNPGATEAFYDGIDQDCDGGDDNDADGDGVAAVAQGGADCDDTDAAVRPSASEVCGDEVDNNCDGAVDDVGTGGDEWYIDDDGDGYGDVPVSACTRPDGSALLDGDCDDADPSRFPNATELCDGEDQDCDGTPDDGLATAVHYEDTDGDGYGVASSTDVRCERNDDGWALLDGDCDDGAASINPGATEVYYDGVDANCDGANDDDADGDGVVAEARGGADCDDTDAAVNPSAEEVCGDGVDQDCAGLTEKCRFPESGELGEPLVSASALSDEADLSFGDLNGDGEMDVAVNGGDNGAFVVFGPLADGGSDPVDVGSILWGMDILETGSGDSYLATISSESHGNSVEVFLESDLESPFMSIDYGSEHIGDAYGVDDSIWVVSDGGVRGFEIVEGRFDMMDSAESVAYPPGDGWRFAVVGCQYLFCMQNSESWLFAGLTESRSWERRMEVHQDFDLEIRSRDLVFTDLNSDGMEDVASAFPNHQAGVVVVGWGSLDAGMVLGDSDSRLDAPFSSRGAFGWSLAAGDIDGDGSVDLVVGSPEHGAGAGRVDLYSGPFVSEASLQSMQPSVTFLGRPGAHLGAEIHVVPSDASAGVRLAVSSHQGFYLLTSPGD